MRFLLCDSTRRQDGGSARLYYENKYWCDKIERAACCKSKRKGGKYMIEKMIEISAEKRKSLHYLSREKRNIEKYQ